MLPSPCQVLPGAKVPTDGVILEGQSYLNEAMVTGESVPKWKRPGDVVIGGTINNSNPLLVKATRVRTGRTELGIGVVSTRGVSCIRCTAYGLIY